MIEVLVVSNILSWLMIIVMGVMLYALSRQIGVLHERIKPVGALSLGKAIRVGDVAPAFHETNLNGGMVRVGGAADENRSMLLFFVSSTCPVCKTLLPILKRLGKQESDWLDIVFASDGHPSEHDRLIQEHNLQDYPYLLSAEVGMAYQISKLPYGVLINSQGIVASHGLLNNREHIESLFEAARSSTNGGYHAAQMAG